MNAKPVPVSGALRPRDDVRAMFDRIVPRYDLMNRIMTGGRDIAWRRLAVREALRGREPARTRILDVATGTGDLALALRRAGAGEVVGLDFSTAMLAEARRKDPYQQVTWTEGDAMALPFPDGSFEAVTVAFGLRNMPDYAAALREMARVLAPGGVLVCLETSPLTVPIARQAFAWYFAKIVPRFGAVLSGDADAYGYLPASAAVFPDAEALGRLVLAAGLRRVRYLSLGLGTVALHVGSKPHPRGHPEAAAEPG